MQIYCLVYTCTLSQQSCFTAAAISRYIYIVTHFSCKRGYVMLVPLVKIECGKVASIICEEKTINNPLITSLG